MKILAHVNRGGGLAWASGDPAQPGVNDEAYDYRGNHPTRNGSTGSRKLLLVLALPKLQWEHEKQGFEHDDSDVVQKCESSTTW